MNRRSVATLLSWAALSGSWAVRAEESAIPVIGFLSLSSLIPWTDNLTAFRRGLKETGYEEGRNVAVEYRWADGAQARVPGLAIDLVRRQVRVIVATGGPSAIRAAMEATSMIPIIFTSGSDPVAQGFVASLNRPNANAR